MVGYYLIHPGYIFYIYVGLYNYECVFSLLQICSDLRQIILCTVSDCFSYIFINTLHIENTRFFTTLIVSLTRWMTMYIIIFSWKKSNQKRKEKKKTKRKVVVF